MKNAKHTPTTIADGQLDQMIGGGGTFGDVVVVKELGGQEQLPNLGGQEHYLDGSDVGLAATGLRRS